MLEKRAARGGLEHCDPIVGVARDLDMTHTLSIDDLIDESAVLRGKVVKARDVDLLMTRMHSLLAKRGLMAWKS